MADLPTRQIQIIRHIETHYGKGWFINHMVLTHADNDHATGLVSVLKHFSVKNLWMNRPWLYAAEVLHHFHGSYELSGLVEEIRERHGYLVELERLAAQQRDNGALRCSKELGSVPSWCWRLRDSGTSLSLAGSREDAHLLSRSRDVRVDRKPVSRFGGQS
jgi:hypothetical protein